MEKITFSGDMVKTRGIFDWTILFLLILALIAGGVFFLAGKPLYWLAEITASIGLIVFLLLAAFLLFYYLRKPEVKEKHRLLRRLKQIGQESIKFKDGLALTLEQIKAIKEQYQTQKIIAQENITRLESEIKTTIETLRAEQEGELARALQDLQMQHLEAGLRAVAIDPDQIPGIGPVLAEDLHEAGILTAWDVTQEAIVAVPGFGESKALSLLRWRESLEYSLRSSQPTGIPEEQRLAIEGKFDAKIREQQETLAKAQINHEYEKQTLQSKEEEALANLLEQENTARQKLASLETEKQEVQAQLEQHGQINFFTMLLAILNGEAADWQKRVISFLLIIGFFFLGAFHLYILIRTLI